MFAPLAAIEALIWTPLSLSTVVLGLRLTTRAKLRSLGFEDLLAVFAWITGVFTAGFAQVCILSDSSDFSRRNFHIAILTGILSLYFGKASVTLFLLRLIGKTSPWQKWFLHINLVIFTGLTLVCFIGSVSPACGNEHVNLSGEVCTSVQRARDHVMTSWNAYGTFTDIAYSTLPIIFLRGVQISPKRKAAIGVLLGLGWIAGVFTVLRAVAGPNMEADIDIANPNMWQLLFWLATALEIPLVIICGSVPTLMPLFDYWRSGKPMTPRNRVTQPPTTRVSESRMGLLRSAKAIEAGGTIDSAV